ncbi:PH domain-containing protein [Nocardioides sp.]|uniref:PH domain-containing protein n=1 Tax=Nocardioides sp. TaxID=35761 RepID=UPI003D0A1284
MDSPRLREPSQRVSPRARLMWRISALLESVALLAALLAATLWWGWFDLRWWMPVVAGVVLAAYVVVMPTWRYAVHRWEATATAVYTQTGWLTIERRIAPMSRIQTVDYAEGAISRIFGLASVTVTTASAAGALEIAGLDKQRARALVDELTRQADTVEGDAT